VRGKAGKKRFHLLPVAVPSALKRLLFFRRRRGDERRWRDENESGKTGGLPGRDELGDFAAHRVADKNVIIQGKRVGDGKNIVGELRAGVAGGGLVRVAEAAQVRRDQAHAAAEQQRFGERLPNAAAVGPSVQEQQHAFPIQAGRVPFPHAQAEARAVGGRNVGREFLHKSLSQ
jgi:hypothetical protein